ncbi:MAG: iron ABC transporter permease [Oscillospiraceae bacterium]|nr:iron ABC transporter permease [Oscillospiraceae bacterium]
MQAIKRHYLLALAFLLLIALFSSLFIGRYAISPLDVSRLIRAQLTGMDSGLAPAAHTAFFTIRLPRIIGTVFVGGGLAAAGAVFQGVFKNPMSSPDILGSSAGSGLGAAIGILLAFPIVPVQIMSFAGGLLAVAVTCGISYSIERRNVSPLTLVLTGLVAASIFNAGISLTKYVADPSNTLPAITFFLLGTFSSVGTGAILPLAILITASLIPMLLLRWKLSVLSMGDEEALTMGVNSGLLRGVMILCATVITSTTVSFCGIIGWVGLVVPHLARMIVGSNYVKLLPASILLGASFTLVVDNIARSLLSFELPIGILTALMGAPFFLILLKRGKRGWA